ncbi:uncharacterized protein ARMOST_19425 [Armillaria ostoyae]|uniref:Uncharacterized protein n=1 Tax=Armillaria ostoyae TaxID=47428 RepID=A0A284S4K2_ARMOS|nr:uncharacterized protein ARMOST_19410 [Armillaria ostoyae]SJL15917.1 uncharacterized protein ARMOST_19425 [Armillaria ostoyae]
MECCLEENGDVEDVEDIRDVIKLSSGYGGGGETNGGREGILCEGCELLPGELELESEGKKGPCGVLGQGKRDVPGGGPS